MSTETRVYCDNCRNEVKYYLIPRYNLAEHYKEIIRIKTCISMQHICEPCMETLSEALNNAIESWYKKDD